MKIISLFLLLFMGVASAREQVTDRILKNDNLDKIALRNLEKVQLKYGKDHQTYAHDIKKWNPLITDWSHPLANQLIYVDYPYNPFVQGSTYTESLERLADSDDEDKVSLAAFFASSVGNYKETIDGQSLSSSQNFPATVGLSISATNSEERKHILDSSIYWAQSTNGSISSGGNTSNNDLSIPFEVGFNLYYQRYFINSRTGFYTGYDYEKLNTFNTEDLAIGGTVQNVINKLHYATLGMNQGFSMFDVKNNFKISFSKSLSSSSTTRTKLSGYKYIFYYTLIPKGRFTFSAFYKHHHFTGSKKLDIDRFGLSIGLIVF